MAIKRVYRTDPGIREGRDMRNKMKLFCCVDHEARWPVGVASVVVAETEADAAHILFEALKNVDLHHVEFTLDEIDLTKEHAIILCDGDY